MPFKSEKQKKWMYANKPKMAKKGTKKYGSKVQNEAKGKKPTFTQQEKAQIKKIIEDELAKIFFKLYRRKKAWQK